jgi:hypothetical protein
MKKLHYLLLASIGFLGGCFQEEPVDCYNSHFTAKLKPAYYRGGIKNSPFDHFIVIDGYKDECFSNYDFILLSYKYLDTVKTNLPVESIRFCTTEASDFFYPEESPDNIRKYSIVSINFSEESLHDSIPEIRSVYYWRDGKSYELDFLYYLKHSQKK